MSPGWTGTIFISIAKGEKSREILNNFDYSNLNIEEYDVNPHSIFLAILSEYGIIGFVIFLVFLIFIFHHLIRNKLWTSILFVSGLLFVSSVSGYVPYYKYYLLICIVFFILLDKNMLINNISERY